MSRIAVLGAGAWGTALAISLARRGGHELTLWSHSAALAEQLAETGENLQYLPGFVLPAGIEVTADLPRAIFEADILLSVTPSQNLRETIAHIAPLLTPEQIILSASKGLEEGTHLRMTPGHRRRHPEPLRHAQRPLFRPGGRRRFPHRGRRRLRPPADQHLHPARVRLALAAPLHQRGRHRRRAGRRAQECHRSLLRNYPRTRARRQHLSRAYHARHCRNHPPGRSLRRPPPDARRARRHGRFDPHLHGRTLAQTARSASSSARAASCRKSSPA